MDGNISNMKFTYEKPTANFVVNGKTLNLS